MDEPPVRRKGTYFKERSIKGVLKPRFLAVVFLAAFSSGALAVEAADFARVDADALRGLIEGRAGAVVVDARTEGEYERGHIPGSVNISPDRLQGIGRYLPRDKGTLLVFYCRGGG